MIKICNTCRKEKPITDYSPHPRSGDGYNHKCKPCINEYQRKRTKENSSKTRVSEFFTRKNEYIAAFVYNEEQEIKTCGRCKKVKSFSDFNKRNAKNGPKVQSYCSQCCTENARVYRNKSTIMYNRTNMDWYIELKSQPCTDCGYSFHPYAMDWDHLPQFTKIADVATLLKKPFLKETVLDEISKCELVCATCHRLRTVKRWEMQAKGNLLLNEIQEKVPLLDSPLRV